MEPRPGTSAPWLERRRPRPAASIATGAFLGCLGLFAALGGSPALADDEKPASSQEKTGQEPGRTEAARSATSEPPASPAPKPSPTPRAALPPAKGRSAPTAPAPPAQTAQPSLRFDDFDLERYHKPVPGPVEEEGEESGGTALAPGKEAAPGGAKTPQAKAKPKPPAAEVYEDPLKPFKDREAREKFRQSQIQNGRDRIARLQARLDYLTAKRNALQNPAPLLPGQTRGQSTPPTPIQGPGKVPIGGFFPAIPPPQTDEDKENDKTLKVKDLKEQVDKEIESVSAELETAREDLARVETRFAQESASR